MDLRLFTISDAPTILSWIKDKTAFRKWSADRYPVFPPEPEDMAAQYAADNIFPFTAVDGEGNIVGPEGETRFWCSEDYFGGV